MKTQKQATQSNQAAIYRCTDKATHEVFYMVKSDSSDAWYQVRFDNSRLAWVCGCPATKPCKHEKAVQEVLAARRARIAQQMGGETPAIVAELQAKEDRKLAQAEKAVAPRRQVEAWTDEEEQRYNAPLNATSTKLETSPSGRLVPMR